MLNHGSEYLIGFKEKYSHLLPESQQVDLMDPGVPNLDSSVTSNQEEVEDVDEIMNDSEDDQVLL